MRAHRHSHVQRNPVRVPHPSASFSTCCFLLQPRPHWRQQGLPRIRGCKDCVQWELCPLCFRPRVVVSSQGLPEPSCFPMAKSPCMLSWPVLPQLAA